MCPSYFPLVALRFKMCIIPHCRKPFYIRLSSIQSFSELNVLLPLFVPSPQIRPGIFGAVENFETSIPCQKDWEMFACTVWVYTDPGRKVNWWGMKETEEDPIIGVFQQGYCYLRLSWFPLEQQKMKRLFAGCVSQ